MKIRPPRVRKSKYVGAPIDFSAKITLTDVTRRRLGGQTFRAANAVGKVGDAASAVDSCRDVVALPGSAIDASALSVAATAGPDAQASVAAAPARGRSSAFAAILGAFTKRVPAARVVVPVETTDQKSVSEIDVAAVNAPAVEYELSADDRHVVEDSGFDPDAEMVAILAAMNSPRDVLPSGEDTLVADVGTPMSDSVLAAPVVDLDQVRPMDPEPIDVPGTVEFRTPEQMGPNVSSPFVVTGDLLDPTEEIHWTFTDTNATTEEIDDDMYDDEAPATIESTIAGLYGIDAMRFIPQAAAFEAEPVRAQADRSRLMSDSDASTNASDDPLSAYFGPLSADEIAAVQHRGSDSEAERASGPITWAVRLGIPEAPRDPSTRLRLVSLARDLDMRDVLVLASTHDPHADVRQAAETLEAE